MRVLEEIGIEFREDEALATWAKAGAKVDGARVRIPRDLLMGLVAQAPERFTLHARDPAKSVEIGGDTMVFGPTYGSPFVRGFDGERRYGTIEDLNNLHKLAYMAPALQNTGAVICEPVDVADPQASPAHHRLGHPPQRQGLHGPGHPPRPRRRRRAHVRDRLRARSSSTTTPSWWAWSTATRPWSGTPP